MMSASAALQCLRDGNQRFAAIRAGDREATGALSLSSDGAFAIILGCSDPRVAPEIIFDQGLNQLFVVRIAGNIVTPAQRETIEFAAERFGIRLVVVLGHSGCQAVAVTIDALRQGQAVGDGPSLLVDSIRPAVEPLLTTDMAGDHSELMNQAVRANIHLSANQLRQGSPVLKQLIQTDGLAVVGAEYSVETGLVQFFEELTDVS